ncbi:citryl-CoA lyase [Raineyella fluvialis]|uniref:citrate synthase (unknown stereospecificity) n=1 Tax=Raineyella fluvialis TaxID=2662261 RepID=A0A5Q2FBE4_9ACTN|nr:citryl-CoA lyase [Raineyella fluvialis]QGF22363.1 citryl-CoA lyase [Raineyella fluvialis]
MSTEDPEALLDEARKWWTTSIVDIHPGEIAMRGYPIEQLIGRITFPEMIWLMLMGELPTRAKAQLLEAALVSSVDHGPQAPSIAIARMAATCGPGLNGAMASAINVLDDVHGGAGQQCMEIYYEVEAEAGADGDLAKAAATVVARRKEQGLKYFPGFGHRFHPLDPRAPRLLQLVSEAADRGETSGRFAVIGAAVEDALSQGRAKRIPMNIDGATAVVYCELGLPTELGRGVFILSRSVGILAHAWEQTQQGGRIKGPQAKFLNYTYDGPARRDLPEPDQRG